MKSKKISLFLVLGLFALSSLSCAQEGKKVDAPKPVEQPETAAVQKPEDKLVYLKVIDAKASGFDETADWAPRPNPMAPVDMDLESRWASAYKDGEWIYFDFGKPKTISKIIIRWEQAYPTSYEILTSDDATDWKRLLLLEDQKGGTNEIAFQPVKCRYVKVVGLKRVNEEWGISMWEFEPYGPADKNPDDLPLEMILGKKEKTAEQKKLDEIRLISDEIVPSPGAITPVEFQKGVNYTSWDPKELASDMSDYSLIHLSQIGVKHIALMTVYYQEDVASKKIFADPKKTIKDESLTHAINIIHALGMKVMLKPHVDLVDEEARVNIIPTEEWFASYKEFILHYAALAAQYNVELLCIGTELSNTTTSRWKDKWMDIIDSIRKIYKGPIVYAANWDEYETVSFWPAVDYIGLDAYFPLTEKNNPPVSELVQGWVKHADVISKWLKDNNINKPIIFTEVGYDTIEGSNRQPWRVLPTLTTYVESQDEQKNCLESIFLALSERSWFKGMYWWNYFPRPDLGPLGYTLRGKKGEKVLTEWYNRLK